MSSEIPFWIITNFRVVFLLIVGNSLAPIDTKYATSSIQANDIISVPGGHKIYYEIHNLHNDDCHEVKQAIKAEDRKNLLYFSWMLGPSVN